MVDAFIWAIEVSSYPFNLWMAALAKHVLESTEIPRPADILKIINPPAPKPDWAVYIELKRQSREGMLLLGSERRFIESCEQYAKSRNVGEQQEYQEAQRRLQQHFTAIEGYAE